MRPCETPACRLDGRKLTGKKFEAVALLKQKLVLLQVNSGCHFFAEETSRSRIFRFRITSSKARVAICAS